MSYDFYIGQNDTSPGITISLLDADDTAVNLVGASVQLRMTTASGRGLVTEAMTVDDEVGGVVSYAWQAGDTAVAGTHLAKIIVTYLDGTIETFPNSAEIRIHVDGGLEVAV